MSKLGLLLLIATFALSGGVKVKAPQDAAKQQPTAASAEPAKQPARQRPEVIPLNTRGYNLPGPNDPPPAALEEAPDAAPAASGPR